MKRNHILLVPCFALALMLVTACGSNNKTDEVAEELTEENPYENAQEFKGSSSIDLYFLGVERIAPDSVKVNFDLVNNGYNNRTIYIKEGDSFYHANNYITIDGKQMSLERIYVNGWEEHKRDFQREKGKKIDFMTPDEWQPSMLPGQTYHCYMIYTVPEDATYINELGICYNKDQIKLEALDI